MIATAGELDRIGNLAELYDHLGAVPLARILFRPLPGTATVQDVIDLDVHQNRLCELVDGVLIDKAYGFLESVIGTKIVAALFNFAESHDLGIVTGAGGPFELRPELVLIPDAAFTSWERFPSEEVSNEPVPRLELLGKFRTVELLILRG